LLPEWTQMGWVSFLDTLCRPVSSWVREQLSDS
jgi:hypothetical protein